MCWLIVDDGVACLIHVLICDATVLVLDFVVPFELGLLWLAAWHIIAIIIAFVIKQFTIFKVASHICIFCAVINKFMWKQSLFISYSLYDSTIVD